METEKYYNIEWRIVNLSHWCAEVHGKCISSPQFFFPYCVNMELYPKGFNGQGTRLVLRFCGNKRTFTGDLSFYCFDGSLLCKQQVNANEDMTRVDLPPGPMLEDVLSRIQESQDFITVRCRIKDTRIYEQRMCTTINVFETSMKINPRWIENLPKSGISKAFGFIQLSSNDFSKTIKLTACSKNKAVQFAITPPTKNETSFAFEVCMSLRRSDGTVDGCVNKRHVFSDDRSWTFLDSVDKTEFVEKGISLFLISKITTKDFIQSPYYMSCDYSSVSLELNEIPCFSGKESSTEPVASSKIGDSVTLLSKDLMCLYQDQDFSDMQLTCDEVSFPGHRNILCARSPVFKTMLSIDMKESSSREVDITDLDSSTLGLFLTYLYTGVAEEMECDSALKLYYAADKYQVPSLRRDCAKFLCAHVSISNVCDILSLADKHQDDELTAASHNFILDNFNAVLKSKEWDTLKKSEPSLAVNTVTQFAVEDRVVRKNYLQ